MVWGNGIEAVCVVYVIALLANMLVCALSRFCSICFSLYNSSVVGLIIIIRHFDSHLSLLTPSNSDGKRFTAALLYYFPTCGATLELSS
jgi:hypothetical protein